jgi:hypothetical protein
VVVASPDVRGEALYLRAGLTARFTIAYFSRRPERVRVGSDLAFVPFAAEPARLEDLAAVDRAVIGHRRDEDHAWLLRDRTGFLCVRDGRPVGYGYVGGGRCGPIALLEERDFPAALAHAETLAHEGTPARAGTPARSGAPGHADTPAGAERERSDPDEELGLDVPLVNRVAVSHLLSRGFRLTPHHMLFLADRPFGAFERYVCMSPTFFF